MGSLSFRVDHRSATTSARVGSLSTVHSSFPTPMFMPVGTRAAVRAVTRPQLEEMGAQIILGNTYHLMLRPGIKIIEQAGGLHAFMRWERSILTDSGGFQVFSLSALNKVTDDGVEFRSHIDGTRHFLGPLESMRVQRGLGSDIVMAFDECCPYPAERSVVERSLERTHRWAATCRDYELQEHQSLFGIVQGGVHGDLRRQSAEALRTLGFAGYAIGGLSVGEPRDVMNRVLETTTPHLPVEAPRYLMGVGTPRNIVEAVMRGVDLFDCVMPTRNARNGTAFTWNGKVNIKAGRYADDNSPLDASLDNDASRYSKAYIRHLLNVDEITGLTLVSLHNLAFYLDLMQKLREAIVHGTLEALHENICKLYPE